MIPRATTPPTTPVVQEDQFKCFGASETQNVPPAMAPVFDLELDPDVDPEGVGAPVGSLWLGDPEPDEEGTATVGTGVAVVSGLSERG